MIRLLMILLAAVNRSGGLTVLGSLLAGFATNLIIQDFYGGTVWLSMLTFLGVGLILANWFDYQKNGDWRAGLTLILLSLVIFTPFLRDIFETALLRPSDWAVVLGLSFLPLVLVELSKAVGRRSGLTI